MKMISIQIPAKVLTRAVIEEIQESRGDKRAAAIAAELGVPEVNQAIDDVITAANKVDNAQHTRGEAAALAELFKAAKILRASVRLSQNVEKEPKQ